MTTAADRYFRLLGFVLLGYALVGKAFAYLGAPPVFVGEFTLAVGLVALVFTPDWHRVLRTARVWPLLAFMLWGAKCAAPYFGRYGADTLRDSAVWGWGLFALVTGSLLAAEPSRLFRLEKQFRFFARWFLVVPRGQLAPHPVRRPLPPPGPVGRGSRSCTSRGATRSST